LIKLKTGATFPHIFASFPHIFAYFRIFSASRNAKKGDFLRRAGESAGRSFLT